MEFLYSNENLDLAECVVLFRIKAGYTTVGWCLKFENYYVYPDMLLSVFALLSLVPSRKYARAT